MAAVGTITAGQLAKSVQVLNGAIATNGSPIGLGDTVGVSVGELVKSGSPMTAGIFVSSSAGSGTMTVTLKAWGMSAAAGNLWAPLGTGAVATRGVLNGGSAIDEAVADMIRHVETLDSPWVIDRFYLEITAIGGTATAINAWLIVPMAQS